MSILKTFSTPRYAGAWFSFDGDRMKFRAQVEAYLQAELSDSDGSLLVNDTGPHWQGQSVQVSYAHTGNLAVLVYSRTHLLGVDIESSSRKLSVDPALLAKRFLDPKTADQIAAIGNSESRRSEFLKSWVKLESYVKLTRSGLKNSLAVSLSETGDVDFAELPVVPKDFCSSIALSFI